MNPNQIRAEQMEKAAAFAAVMAGRLKLDGARKRLATVEADLAARPRQPTETRDQIRNHVVELESALAEAELYCMTINPGQLREYDEKVAAAKQAAERDRKAQEVADKIATLETRDKRYTSSRARQEDYEAARQRALEAALTH